MYIVRTVHVYMYMYMFTFTCTCTCTMYNVHVYTHTAYTDSHTCVTCMLHCTIMYIVYIHVHVYNLPKCTTYSTVQYSINVQQYYFTVDGSKRQGSGRGTRFPQGGASAGPSSSSHLQPPPHPSLGGNRKSESPMTSCTLFC